MPPRLPSAFAHPSPLPPPRSSNPVIAKRPRTSYVLASAAGSGAPGPAPSDPGGTDSAWLALQRRVHAVRELAVEKDRRCARNWRTGAYTTAVVAAAPVGDFVRRVDVDGGLLACGTAQGSVCLFDLPTRARVAYIGANEGQTTAVCVRGAFLASVGAADHCVCVWDVAPYRRSLDWDAVRGAPGRTADGLALPPPRFRLAGHSAVVSALRIDPRARRLFSASVDGTIKVWDLSDGSLVRTISVGEPVLCMVLTEGNYILAGCASGRVQAFLADKGLFLLAINCHNANTTAVHFHEETQTLATGDASGNVKLWSFEESRCIGSYPSHSGPVMAIQIDETKVVTASRDGSLSVAAIESKEVLFNITGFTKYISSCMFDHARLMADGTNNIIACHRFDIK